MESGLKGIIRVLIVDDSPLMCKALTDILNSDPQIMVVGIAYNGKEAIDIVPKLKPDIITMDIHMPIMDGFEATKHIMAYNPTPILILSTSVFKAGMDKVFKAIYYGALDAMEKGDLEINKDADSTKLLIEKIKLLSGVKVISHPLAKLEKEKIVSISEFTKEKALDRIVAIAASTGGPQALMTVLRSFPAKFPCGIVIVQHITSGFLDGLVDWLNNECKIKVKVAQDSEQIMPGVAYIAPCEFQMRVTGESKISLANEPSYNGHRPSADILLESVARVYKEGAIGVILTGMGRDGLIGMKTIKQMRGKTIAQDEKSCVVFGMPKEAIEAGVIEKVLPLERIADEIVRGLKR